MSMMIQIQNKAVSWPRGTAASTAIPNSRSESSNDCLDGKITTSYHWLKDLSGLISETVGFVQSKLLALLSSALITYIL